MATDALRESRPADRRGHRTLNGDGLMDVIPRRRSKSGSRQIRAAGNTNCRAPISRGGDSDISGRAPPEGPRGQGHPRAEIALMSPLHLFEMLGETGLDRESEAWSDGTFWPFPTPRRCHGDGRSRGP